MADNRLTLLRKIWIVLIVSLIAVLSFAAIWRLISVNQDYATQLAQEYASHIKDAEAVKCNRYDSDGDGYVSCTIFRQYADPLQIECGISGCRIPKSVFTRPIARRVKFQ